MSLLVFLDKSFKFEPNFCNCCHDLMQIAMNFNDVATVSVERSDYRIHFWYMSKDDAIIIMKNSDLREKSGSLQKNFSCLNIRKNEHFRTRLLEQAKQYYENNEERLQEQARIEYTELSNEEKI